MATEVERILNLKVNADTAKIAKVRSELPKLTKSVFDSKKALADYKKELKGVNTLSNAQAEKLSKLEGAYKKNTTTLNKAKKATSGFKASTGGLTKSLAGLGIAFAGVAAIGAAAFAFVKEIRLVNKEIGKATSLAKQFFGVGEKDGNELAKQARIISQVFDLELNETLETAAALSKNFGITGAEALNLLTETLEKGGNARGELLSQLQEYSVQFAEVGLSASESLAIITQFESSALVTDKAADSIKEFGIRIRELTPATDAALAGIGLSGKKIQEEIKNGTKTVFDVLQDVSSELGNFSDNAQEVGVVMADVFGGPGEDLGASAIKSFANLNLELGDMESNLSESEKATNRLAEAQAQLQNSLSDSDSFVGGLSLSLTNFFSTMLEGLVLLGKTPAEIYAEVLGGVESRTLESAKKVNIDSFVSDIKEESAGLVKDLENQAITQEQYEEGLAKIVAKRYSGTLKQKEDGIIKTEEEIELLNEQIRLDKEIKDNLSNADSDVTVFDYNDARKRIDVNQKLVLDKEQEIRANEGAIEAIDEYVDASQRSREISRLRGATEAELRIEIEKSNGTNIVAKELLDEKIKEQRKSDEADKKSSDDRANARAKASKKKEDDDKRAEESARKRSQSRKEQLEEEERIEKARSLGAESGGEVGGQKSAELEKIQIEYEEKQKLARDNAEILKSTDAELKAALLLETNKYNREVSETTEKFKEIEKNALEGTYASKSAALESALEQEIRIVKDSLVTREAVQGETVKEKKIREQENVQITKDSEQEIRELKVDTAKEQRDLFIEENGEIKNYLGETLENYKQLTNDLNTATTEATTDPDTNEKKTFIEKLLNPSEENKEAMKEAALQLFGEISDALFQSQSEQNQRLTDSKLSTLEQTNQAEEDILLAKFDDGLITEAEYESQREALAAETAAKELEIKKKAFQKEKRLNISQALINGALAVLKVTAQTGVAAPLVIPAIIASTAVQVATIASQKYKKGGRLPEFQNGGVLQGPSHNRGGVPLYNNGQQIAEAEGGEFIVNRAATQANLALLESINANSSSNVFPISSNLEQIESEANLTQSAINRNTEATGVVRAMVTESDISGVQTRLSKYRKQSSVG